MSKRLLLIVIVLLVAGIGWWLWQKHGAQPVYDAPDTTNWQAAHNDEQGFSYRYPQEFSPTYISVQEWPPVVTISDGKFSCADEEFIKQIAGQRYCVEQQSEGAAGSIYTSAVYTTEQAGKIVTVSLTIREVQCDNYNDPEKTACQNEREEFKLDTFVHSIVQTVTIDP